MASTVPSRRNYSEHTSTQRCTLRQKRMSENNKSSQAFHSIRINRDKSEAATIMAEKRETDKLQRNNKHRQIHIQNKYTKPKDMRTKSRSLPLLTGPSHIRSTKTSKALRAVMLKHPGPIVIEYLDNLTQT